MALVGYEVCDMCLERLMLQQSVVRYRQMLAIYKVELPADWCLCLREGCPCTAFDCRPPGWGTTCNCTCYNHTSCITSAPSAGSGSQPTTS